MSISPENQKRMVDALRGTPKSEIARLGDMEFVKGKPAIVQPAVPVKNHAYWLARGLEIKNRYKKEWGQFLKDYKESGDWKEVHLTWDDACEELGIPKRTANHQIAEQSKVSIVGKTCPPENNLSKGSSTSTGQSPTILEPTKQGPYSEVSPSATKPRTESGKPKRELPIWRELEERLLGVAANRVDTLNHEYPNAAFHKKLQDQLSACFETLALWKESVQ